MSRYSERAKQALASGLAGGLQVLSAPLVRIVNEE